MLQADKSMTRQRQLKRQVDEGEEEIARLNASKRKIQRDLDEMTESYEQAQRDLDAARGKLRAGTGARIVGYVNGC